MNGFDKAPQEEGEITVDLRILATTDVHLHVLPFDYYRNSARDSVGLARTASLIHRARAERENVLLVDNGDFLCGLPLDLTGYDLEPRSDCAQPSHPVVRIMNHLGYDAVTLGNHDFDHGSGFVRRALSGAGFAVVASNLNLPPDPDLRDLADPILGEAILERDVTGSDGLRRELRIGVAGFLPPGSMTHAMGDGPRPEATDMLKAAHASVDRLRAAGADVVIALAHTGIFGGKMGAGQEGAAGQLAAIDGLDAVVAGHLHQVFPGDREISGRGVNHRNGTIHGKPVVSAGFWGSHLGLIDLRLAWRAGGWQVEGRKGRIRAISRRDRSGALHPLVRSDEKVAALARPIHEKLQRQIGAPVGRTRLPIHSYFALAAPSSAVQVVQQASLWFARHRSLPDIGPDHVLLASAAPFRNGGLGAAEDFTSIAPGSLTMRDVADLYPFPNQIAFFEITGAGLRAWLERAASVFNRLAPARKGQRLKLRDVPGYLFETVLGCEYTIDLSRPARYSPWGEMLDPAASRIDGLTCQGRPVAPDQPFVLISNTHRAQGGGKYPAQCLSRPLTGPESEMREVLFSYFGAHPALDLDIAPHWRLTARPGTQAHFCTAPAAYAHAPGGDAPFEIPSPIPQETGFLDCVLRF